MHEMKALELVWDPFSVVFARSAKDSEIIAMRSFGASKRMLFRPFLILGVIIFLGLIVLSRNVIPYANSVFSDTVIRLGSKGMLSNIEPGQFYLDIPGVTLFSEDVVDDGKSLEHVFIKFTQNNSDKEQVIMARSGSIVKKSSSDWKIPTIRMQARLLLRLKAARGMALKGVAYHSPLPQLEDSCTGGFRYLH